MLGAIYIGLSGMNAYSKGLQTISNNVANMNTSGFKSTSVHFTDLYSSGGGGLSYAGGGSSGNGVRVTDAQINFKQGDLRQTDNDLDLAIQGNGFLVLLDDDKSYYARTGQFTVSDDGYIVEQGTGYRLGALDDKGGVSAINIDAKRTSPPQKTTTIRFADNLSSSGTQATVANIKVYDDVGGEQTWTVVFDKAETATGATSTWTVTVKDAAGTTVGSSQLNFIGSIVDPTTSSITIDTAPPGASPLSIKLDFSEGVTSYSSGTTSTLRAASVDGHGVGSLSTVTVDDDGQIKLTYSNEESDLVGAIAIADFRDQQKLERVGEGLFKTKGMTEMRLRASGVDGVGTVQAKQLESSNVDLSFEFGELILIQRGFQASSQVVSVSNDMIQQLFGIRGQG